MPVVAATQGEMKAHAPAPAAPSAATQEPPAMQRWPSRVSAVSNRRSDQAASISIGLGSSSVSYYRDSRSPCSQFNYFCLCLACTLVWSLLSIVCFSFAGMGDAVYVVLQSLYGMHFITFAIFMTIMTMLYLFDFFWPPHMPGKYLLLWDEDHWVGRVLFALAMAFLIASCFLTAKFYPAVPLLLSIFLSPITVAGVRFKWHAKPPTDEIKQEVQQQSKIRKKIQLLEAIAGQEEDDFKFFKACFAAFVLTGLTSVIIWAVWFARSGHSAGSSTENTAHILWACPLLVGISNWVFGLFVLLRIAMQNEYVATDQNKAQLIVDQRGQTLKKELMDAFQDGVNSNRFSFNRPDDVNSATLSTGSTAIVTSAATTTSSRSTQVAIELKRKQWQQEHDHFVRKLSLIVKLVAAALLVTSGVLYIAFLLLTINSYISSMVMGLIGVFFVSFVLFTCLTFRRIVAAMEKWLHDLPAWKAAGKVAKSDLCRAVLVFALGPGVPGILFMSWLNQIVRKKRGLYDKGSSPAPPAVAAVADAARSSGTGTAVRPPPGDAGDEPPVAEDEDRLPAEFLRPSTATNWSTKAVASEALLPEEKGASVPPKARGPDPEGPDSGGGAAGPAEARVPSSSGSAAQAAKDKEADDDAVMRASAANSFIGYVPTIDPSEHGDLRLTPRVHITVYAIMCWNWHSILVKLYVLCAIYFAYTICPVLLNVFLAGTRLAVADLEYWFLVVITFFIGVGAFLLPPIPGLTIYVFGGLVLSDPNGPYGWWGGAHINIAVGFFLKLFACAIQQKCIGQCLGQSLLVRRTVGVHKVPIRCIHAILATRGWSIGKVAILCGGPDWPTSVLAGVLKLSLFQCELGTLPIIFFVTPCALTGSCYLRRGESESWSNVANTMLMASVGVSLFLWALAAYAIQRQLEQNHDELTRPLPQNVDLEWLDHVDEELAKACDVKWGDVPRMMQAIYAGGAFVHVMVCQFFFWCYSYIFGEFDVSDNFNDVIWYGTGKKYEIFSFGSVGAIIVYALAWLAPLVFGRWRSGITKRPRGRARAEMAVLEATWKENWVRAAECWVAESSLQAEQQKAVDGAVQQVMEELIDDIILSEKPPAPAAPAAENMAQV